MSRLVLSPQSDIFPRYVSGIETRYAPVLENFEGTRHGLLNDAVTGVDLKRIFSGGIALDAVAEIKHPPLRISGHRRNRDGFRVNLQKEKGHFGTTRSREINTQGQREAMWERAGTGDSQHTLFRSLVATITYPDISPRW